MTLDILDLTVFEWLRLKSVELGHLPDWRSINDQAAYTTAKEAIKTGGKEIIEIYGVGRGVDRNGKKLNHITINRTNIGKGSLGLVPWFVDAGATYTKTTPQSFSSNIMYEIRCFASSTKYKRILEEMLISVFGFGVYKNTFDISFVENSEALYFRHINNVDVTSTDEMFEILNTIMLDDVSLAETETVNVPKLSTVEYDLYHDNVNKITI